MAIESRGEPLVTVNMEAFDFTIAVKRRKHSLKFYVDRLPRQRNYDGLLGFGLSHSYEVSNKFLGILFFRKGHPCFKILTKNTIRMNGELYHYEESQYCLKLENFDVYSKMIKHQDTPSNLMMKFHAQIDPK